MTLLTIPVWTVPPDWADVVTETLEWKTGVFTSIVGAEQRQSTRLSPRRTLEFTVRSTGFWRQYFDALMTTQYQEKFYLPLWHDRGKLAFDHPSGLTTINVADVRDELSQATVLFVQGGQPYLYELAEVASVSVVGGNTQFVLAAPLDSAWKAGTPVFAVVPAMLTAQPQITRLSDDAAQGVVNFTVLQKNDWGYTETLPTYRSYPVVDLGTNEGESQTGSYFRLVSQLDNVAGIPVLKDFGQNAFQGFNSTNFVTGLTSTNALRTLLYQLRGMRNAAWFPLPTNDFTLVQTIEPTDTFIVTARNGFTDLGGPTTGRQDIRIRLHDGTILYRRIVSSSVRFDNISEALTLDTPLGAEVRPESVARISFMGLGRLDQDLITLTHTTDTEGVCDYALAFKLVPDTRVGADWFPPPFPLDLIGECGPSVDGTFWVRVNNGPWNANPLANPSIGVGGLDVSSISNKALFPLLGFNTGFYVGSPHEGATANFGASPFTEVVPYRAAAWGVACTWNGADLYQVNLSNGNLTGQLGGEITGAFVRATESSNTQFGFRYYEVKLDRPAQDTFVGFATKEFLLSQPLFGSDSSGSVWIRNGGQVFLNGGPVTGLNLGGAGAGDTIGVLIYTVGGEPL